MTEDQTYKRWYDEDPIVAKCLRILESIPNSVKRQTATYLMDEIINKPPYIEMIPDEIFTLATSEKERRRWYDYDEIIRIFIELIRHAPADMKRKVAVMAISFIEDQQEIDAGNIQIED